MTQNLLLSALLVNIVIMLGTWFFSRTKNNYSIVDAVWAYSFSITALLYALFGDGFLGRRLLMLICVSVWSLRLGTFLARRIASHHPLEDSRYQELRRSYGDHVSRGFFWFFQYQAWSVVLLSGPFLILALNPDSIISPLEYGGVLLFILSLLGESLADHQAYQFKSNPDNKNKVCNVGLWKYSRHPNYFFESCIWFSFFILSLSSPYGVYMIYAPLLILFLLLKVTGVPLSEAQSLKSRGDAYRNYQKSTSMFFPWFPKIILIFLLTVPAVIQAQTLKAPPPRTAKIYALGKMNEAPVFIQKTNYTLQNDSQEIQARTVIVDQQGESVLTEVAIYKGPQLISHVVDQLQTQIHYEVSLQGEKIIFRENNIGPEETNIKTSGEKYDESFTLGPLIEEFISLHWQDLMEDKTIEARFGVPELRRTVNFGFKLKEKDQKIARVSMRPSNYFVRLAVDPITIEFDLKTKRYVRYVGRTPLQIKAKSKWIPFDAEIVYE